MKAFNRALSASMFRRHSLVMCSLVISRARSFVANSSIVMPAARVVVEIGRAQRVGRTRQRFEDRFERGQPAAIRVGQRQLQPLLDGHDVFTEIDTPSRSGMTAVSR